MGESRFFNFNVELYKDSDQKMHVYIASDNSSGCDYLCKNVKEVKENIYNYVDDYMSLLEGEDKEW